MKLVAVLVVGSLACLSGARSARADSTICREGNLAVTGDRMYEVYANCGAPSWSRRSARDTEEWVYDLGYGSFPRLLRFQRGVLVEIIVLGRGW